MESGSNFVLALLDSVDQSGTPTASNATRAKVREIVAKRRRAQQASDRSDKLRASIRTQYLTWGRVSPESSASGNVNSPDLFVESAPGNRIHDDSGSRRKSARDVESVPEMYTSLTSSCSSKPESVIAPDSPPEELLHDPNWPDDCGEPKLPEVPYPNTDSLYLEDEVQIVRNDRRTLQNPWSPLGTTFDPFTPFSGPISDHDKKLLYYYFVMVPAIYGTNPNTTYCPVRDATYPQSLSDPVTRQWALLAAEVKTSSSPETPSILRRRTYLYYLMARTLSDPKKRTSDIVMTGLGSAAVVEARLGGFAKAKMHFTALQHLLAERGGLHTAQNLPMRETTILMIAFMGMIGLEDCPFRTMVELETAKRKFVDAFKNLARWNETNSSSKQVSVEDQANISKTFVSGVAENTFRLFHQVTSLRGGVFSLFSPLRAYVAKISPSTDLVQRLSHFMILYSINLVLWELQNDQATRTTFINKILNDVYSATIPGTSQSSLKINTVALMVFYRSAEVVETNGLKDGLWRLLKVLDVLRIMQLVSAPTWDRLTGLMSNWLTGEEDEVMTDAEWESIEVDIMMSWLHKRGSMTSVPNSQSASNALEDD